ncbi:MAG: UDP-2,3-diacylglucosamine diphosphatase LpxI, partial [Acidobacteria bacterium]|nr:UDP-2,3-diacylglucosamine diphosphatase LpxI [Acidobacteriota bacterium]
VKVIRTRQDYRIDLPAVGEETVRNMIEARFAGLCFEADRMPFFQREEAVQLADRHGLALYARSRPD